MRAGTGRPQANATSGRSRYVWRARDKERERQREKVSERDRERERERRKDRDTESGAATGCQPGGGGDVLGTKLFHELGTNLKEKDQNSRKRYTT